jgi:hypothetical protein
MLSHELSFFLQSLIELGALCFFSALKEFAISFLTFLLQFEVLLLDEGDILEDLLDHFEEIGIFVIGGLAAGEFMHFLPDLLLDSLDLLLMFVDVNDFCEVDDGRVIELALLFAGDEFDVVDGEVVLEKFAVMLLVVLLEGSVFVLQLLNA